MAGVQRDAQPVDVVAEYNQGVWVAGQASVLTQQPDPRALGGRNIHQLPQPFDFFVEGRTALLARANDQRHHLGGLGQAADGIELPIVLLAGG